MRGSLNAMRRSLAIIAVGGCLALPALAEEPRQTAEAAKHGLPQADRPEELGFSSERLDRLSKVFKAGVDNGEIPGAVIEIARDGKLAYVEAIGFRDPAKKTPMTTDAIFRIASMSKPITAVAAMILVEQGKIDLAAPVSDYLPEFKEMKVAVEQTDPQTGKVEVSLQPARRPMTVQDLLRHTSGLTYGSRAPATVAKAYAEANLFDWNQTLAEMVTKLSKIPLVYQPGTTFEYSMSFAVLGRVVEVASGMPLDQFVAERITGPLGMTATGYGVKEADRDKIAQASIDPATGKPAIILDTPVATPHWIAGGEGMWSSADDYLRFCQMLLNRGELNGVRLLSPKTVDLMTSDHLPPGIAYGESVKFLNPPIHPSPEMGQGYGLGFAVRKDTGHNPLPGSIGEFYWGGVNGTMFWVDPSEKLVAIMMTQTLKPRWHYNDEMRYLTYQAMIEEPAGQVLSGTSVKPH